MRSKMTVFVVLLFTLQFGQTQNCFPSGLYINSQDMIDSFSIHYPNCTIIDGDFEINGNMLWDITDFSGLSQIIRINGGLKIRENFGLENLSGLENLRYIGGDCDIDFNYSLKNIAGLQNVDSIGGHLYVDLNFSLSSLSGLSDLFHIGGGASISGNLSLKDIIGLHHIDSLSFLNLSANDSLVNFSGLDNLEAVTGDVHISENRSLKRLMGLEELKSIGGVFSIFRNVSLLELAEHDLRGIHRLKSIGSDLIIYGNDTLSSLMGLQNLDSIPGSLRIENNRALNDISDLDGISAIGRELYIAENASLSNLSGFQNLQHVGTNLVISSNPSLTSLSKLEKLTDIGGFLWIIGNERLRSLEGLQNINPNSIDALDPFGNTYDLQIWDNSILSECSVQSICQFLLLPDKVVFVGNNQGGCNDEDEVKSGCTVAVNEIATTGIYIYPNPIVNELYVFSESSQRAAIYDILGYRIKTFKIIEGSINLKLMDLETGLYILKTEHGVVVKFLKN